MDDILLSEEPLVSYDKIFLNIMLKNNITTLNQVLNIQEDNLNYSHCALKNIQKTRGLIGLLKYKYRREDLLVSPILEKSVSINLNAELENISEDEIYRLGFSDEDINYFRRFNFYLIRNETEFSMKFIDYLRKYLAYDKKSKLSNNNTVKIISAKIALYLEYAKKNLEIKNIEDLKQTLKTLLDERDMLNLMLNQMQTSLTKIDAEIVALQSRIAAEGKNK